MPFTLEMVNERGVSVQNFVGLTVSPRETVTTPLAPGMIYRPSRQLLQLTKLFKPEERVTLVERGDAYEATVTRPGPAGMTGGTEAYSIDKRTLEKKLLWHEAPHATSAGGTGAPTSRLFAMSK